MSSGGLLHGKAVAITGSTRGLGRAYALAAAREGASVLVNGTTAEGVDAVVREIAAAGGVAEGVVRTIGDFEAARELVGRCVRSFGRLDGFVNNAAIIVRQPHAWQHTEDEVRQTCETNLLGTISCSIAAVDQMVMQGSGSLVNIISMAAFGLHGTAVYGATKAAVAAWTSNLALDLNGTGVRANAISPTAQTEMLAPFRYRDRPPPESAAPMAVFLLSELSAHLNGQIFRIVGRRIALLSPAEFRDPIEADEWTAETIAEAVQTTLKDQIVAVGVDRSRHPEFADRAYQADAALYRGPADAQ
jgi:NAD(P)-dependent dehydrogenase (short-subunit alcohol dehydrogenase family)